MGMGITHAQNTVCFDYDASGNMTGRHVPIRRSENRSASSDTFYYDDGTDRVSVYPSPTSGPLNVKVHDFDGSGTLTIVNTNIGFTTSIPFTGENAYIDLSSQPKGVYQIVLQLTDVGESVTRQINSIKIFKK
jgi:YD repeat-containing protein